MQIMAGGNLYAEVFRKQDRENCLFQRPQRPWQNLIQSCSVEEGWTHDKG